MSMLLFFGYLFIAWVLVYSVVNTINYAKARKEQEILNNIGRRYFKD